MAISPLPKLRDITYPYRPDVEQRLRENSVTHVFGAIAYPVTGAPIPLDVTGVGITFDESWSPYIQADIVAKLIDDQETLDRLDPRLNCRVQITLGYVYDAKETDTHVIADLHLRSREVMRPANEIKLTAWSDEGKLQDRRRWPGDGAVPKTGINEVIEYAALAGAFPGDVEVISQFGAGYGANYLTELEMEIGDTYASLAQDVANRTDVWVRCDGERNWYITRRSEVAGVSAHKLLTGPDGTIIGSDVALQREDYANNVILKYAWRDLADVDRIMYGTAQVTGTGQHGKDAIGLNTYFEERTGPVTQFAANAAAQTVLKYKLTRGRGTRIDAVAAYWLRPGQTVTIQLPTGDQERHIVRAVSFTPGSGSMTVTTRQPENI